jgi:hypothetical protein
MGKASSPRARWLAGTLIFGLIFALFLGPLIHPIGEVSPLLSLLGFISSFGTAYFIGTKLRDDAWWLGPPVAVMVVVIILIVIPDTGGAFPIGRTDFPTKAAFLVFLRLGGFLVLIALAALYASLGSRGVHAEQEAERERLWQEDEAFRTMFQTIPKQDK